jgi:gamma-glutamyltranspeptidase/glutathione hydrolase
MTIDGRAPRVGELWRNPNLANTLERIAREGREVFYRGEIARVIGDYMQANGGFLSYEDLADHRSEWVEPVSVNYRGYDVWELPPNGQGIAALQILNILEQFDVAQMGFGSADHVHLFLEAKKLAFEDRARFYADPAYMDVSVERLLSDDYARERAALIDMNRAARAYPHGDPEVLREGDTIYLTTADANGNMVSLIQSNYRGMGSGMTPPGLGFVLQDRGELFSLEEGHPNAYAPGKLPFHTIIPAFITRDGEPFISFGLMGGGMQPQGHAQIVMNLVDFGMGLQEAGDAPRIHHSGSSEPTGGTMTDGGTVNLETGFDYAVIRNLMGRGHRIEFARGPYGGYQAIMKHPEFGTYFGASESRKDGQAAGF